MIDRKLNEVYYQPVHLWTDGKAIKDLHKITSLLKKDARLWLTKQGLWQVQIRPTKEINHPHYDVAKPNE